MTQQKRWHCYFDVQWEWYVLVDLCHPDVVHGERFPEEAMIKMSPEAAAALMAIVPGKEAESRSFDKEVTRRHLDIIEKMLQT